MKRVAFCLALMATGPAMARAQTASDLYQRGLMQERTMGKLDSAIVLYQRVAKEAGGNRALAARALLSLGRVYETLGRTEARAAYRRLLHDYGDQRDLAALARARMAALEPRGSQSSLLSAPPVRRVSNEAKDFTSGTLSPDGRYASFTDPETGDVAVLDIVSGLSRRVTSRIQHETSTAYAEYSAFSPNSLDIAYVWYTDSSGVGRYELRVVPVQGGRPRVIRLRDIAYLELCGWTPDGKHLLAVVHRTERSVGELALVGVDAPTVEVLRTFDYSAAFGASVSPDGKWIAFAFPANNELGSNPVIHLMTVSGTSEQVLVDHPSANWGPRWTPDGRGVAFQSDRTGNESLWFQQVLTGKAVGAPVLLKSDMGGDWPLGFSRDDRLFFTSTALRDISVTALDSRSGDVPGSAKIMTAKFVGSNIDPDWSPDGRSLAFVSMRGPGGGMAPGTRKLVVVDLASGAQREFAPRLRVFQHPRWSRDGHSILVVGSGADHANGFYRMDVATGALATIMTTAAVSFRPFEWSADGQSVFYPRVDSTNARTSLWRYDLADSTHRPVYDPDSLILARSIAPSPDGRWLVFSATYRNARGPQVEQPRILSLETGELRNLPAPPRPAFSNFFWLADGTLLGAQFLNTDSATVFWRVPTDGSPLSTYAFRSKIGMLGAPRVAPDGSKLAIPTLADYPNTGGIWTIENFLPSRRTRRNAGMPPEPTPAAGRIRHP